MEKIKELNAAFIPIIDGKVLMFKRNDWQCWEFPGGGVEFGEHPKEAAIRELYEETALKPKTISFVDITSRVYTKNGVEKHSIYIIYGGGVVGNINTSNNTYNEHSTFHLFSLHELSNLKLCYNSIVDLEKLRRLIENE